MVAAVLALVATVQAAEALSAPRPTAEASFRTPQIAGGELVGPADWPFVAAVVSTYSDGSEALCSGTVIGARWVLTAAHCLTDPAPVRVDVALAGGLLSGETWVTNSGYDPVTLANDIGVIRLPSDYTGVALRMAGAADSASFEPRKQAVVLGWGATSLADTSPPALRAAEVEIGSPALCSGAYPGFAPALMICAGLVAGVGSCIGDSGGPLIVLDRDGLPMLAGIVGYGPADGCGASYAPDVYTRVAAYSAGLASFLASDPVAPVGAPIVSASSVPAVGETTASVEATIAAGGLATTYRVEFGTGAQLNRSVAGYAGAGGPATVGTQLTGLRPGTTYNYRVVATNAAGEVASGTQTFTTAGQAPIADTVPPTVRALASAGRAGGRVNLRFRVFDNASRRTREVVTVHRRNGSRIATVRTRFSLSERGNVYHVAWRAPRSLVGRFRFCVQAEDPSGNRSARSCARLVLRAPVSA